MTRILSLQEIMEADDITEKAVPVPQWGGSVVVKSISHRTMRNIKKAISDAHGGIDPDDIDEDELEKWIFIKGLVEPQVDEEAYERLLDKSTGAITTILTEILGRSKSEESAITEAEKSLPTGSERVLPVSVSGESVDDGGNVADGEAKTA